MKKRVGVIFGGRSGEHEVSLRSARSVLQALDPQKYDVIQIGITLEGEWVTGENVLEALERHQTEHLKRACLLPEPGHPHLYVREIQGDHIALKPYTDLDVVFPVLHGTFGEDGTLQGLLELAGVAYVGAGVTASALGMDKALFKQIMQAHHLPVVEYLVFTRAEIENDRTHVIEAAEALAPYPLFTKPVNLGSSVGITKCHNRAELVEGLEEAARYDRRILIERGIDRAREIEVSVLGNEQPIASVPGEVVPDEEFYSYASKYLNSGTQLLIPAPLPETLSQEVRRLAVAAYRAVDCAGMARVDFLLDPQTQRVYISEINTLPGFTEISMYPKLWEASGLPYSQLLDRLITLALERKAERDRTQYVYRREG
ncbi:D-alanine--D-alanine ligase family protein [uncultured Thermanaerothrix sp.]|uniref:D-alanine--D-alanine ligase family protein n=1 Tax=uncultured Thermanaerothrix sp. TaxID=1195149 RepID=UPI002632AA6C|nr:D-alanine--D-alanine ligase family protein [uncultured Thermanaerothrix sp.]